MVTRATMTPEQLAEVRAYDRARQAAIPLDEKRAYNAAWRATVTDEWRESKRAYNRERYQRRREFLNAQSQAYRFGPNRELVLERERQHYYSHREAAIARMIPIAARRRARQAGVSVYRFTAADWRRVCTRYEGRCFYCGVKPAKLTKDHVIPLARGGQHSEGNIVPACWSCNRSKHTKTVVEWRRHRRRLGLAA